MHTLHIFTAPDNCRAVLAALYMAATYPSFGQESGAAKLSGVKDGKKGLGAVKLHTVIASNVLQLVGKLSKSRGSFINSSVTQPQLEEEKRANAPNAAAKETGAAAGVEKAGREARIAAAAVATG
jgi:hypothetical protein